MKFLRSKFFIIALFCAVILVVVPSVLAFMGQGAVVTKTIGLVTTPVRFLVTQVTSSISGFIDYFDEFDALSAENRILKTKLAELEDELYDAELAKEENEWLYNYLGIKREHIDYELEKARVIGREAGNYLTVVTLDRGSMHGIEANMPVITSDGIVGYVSEVGTNYCKVLTLIESASSVGAYVERSGELGLVSGVYELRGEGYCKMSYLPSDTDIKVGDRVLSSGIGSIYPRGLVIGTVTEIAPDEYGRNLEAVIEPAATLTGDLSSVMIIKGFNAYTEGGEVESDG